MGLKSWSVLITQKASLREKGSLELRIRPESRREDIWSLRS
jgi:hypothetical protein